MRIFVYEHLTGGGMLSETPEAFRGLMPEAAAMVGCVSQDFAKLPDTSVEHLHDARLPVDVGIEHERIAVRKISTSDEYEIQFDELAKSCDATLLIAPETNGILTSLARRVERLGGTLLSPSSEFCEWASDKSRVAETLQAVDAPVPAGVRLAWSDPWPSDFAFPAVLKPNDGCGAMNTYRVTKPDDDFRTAEHPVWRLERFIPGKSVSVPFVAGPQMNIMLCSGFQDVRCDGKFKYLGGSMPLTSDLDQRLINLMLRCGPAIPGFSGYIGIDAVLGVAVDGSEDYLIEINPRITTSYIGQREISRNNLAELMLDLHAERPVESSLRLGSLSFRRNGEVCSILEE